MEVFSVYGKFATSFRQRLVLTYNLRHRVSECIKRRADCVADTTNANIPFFLFQQVIFRKISDVKREKELDERSKYEQTSVSGQPTQSDVLRKFLFKRRKPSEPNSAVNSIQPKPSTDQTPAQAPTGKPSGGGMSLMSLIAKAKEAKEAEKQSAQQDQQLSGSSPTKQKQQSSKPSGEQPLNILPHPQPTKTKWAALAAGAGAPITAQASTTGTKERTGQTGGILHSVFSQDGDKKTELVCKKSDYVQIVRDIRPAQTGSRWSRPVVPISQQSMSFSNLALVQSTPRPDTIEEFDEYGTQLVQLSQYPESDDLIYHDDHSSSGSRAMAPVVTAGGQPRLQHQPSIQHSLALTTTSDSPITIAQQQQTVSGKQFYSTTAPSINLLNTEQFLTSMVELKMELRSEMQKLNSKINSIDEVSVFYSFESIGVCF